MLSTLILAAAVAFSSPEAVVEQFCARYVKLGDSFDALDPAQLRPLAPMLSDRLQRKLAELRECQQDWSRQQPKDTTDKPPYVDCCVFSGIPDGMPRTYAVRSSENLPDGRVKVLVDFTWTDGQYTDKWQDAYVVKNEKRGWVIDDFLARGEKPSLVDDYTECRNGKYVE